MQLARRGELRRSFIEHKREYLLATILLATGMILGFWSGAYVDRAPSAPVPDLVLDAIPTINLFPLFVWGMAIVVLVYYLYPLLFAPHKLHQAIGMAGLFLIIRSLFITFTHLQVHPDTIDVAGQGAFHFATYANDLFFSGHAGFPFLGFLLYDHPLIKRGMLAASIVLAITVLLMHVHYTIDVASAYFITYGIYKLGERLFREQGTEQRRETAARGSRRLA